MWHYSLQTLSTVTARWGNSQDRLSWTDRMAVTPSGSGLQKDMPKDMSFGKPLRPKDLHSTSVKQKEHPPHKAMTGMMRYEGAVKKVFGGWKQMGGKNPRILGLMGSTEL